jgi:hypothetical protein
MGYHVDEHAVNVFDSITGFVYTAIWVIPNVVLYRPGPPPRGVHAPFAFPTVDRLSHDGAFCISALGA